VHTTNDDPSNGETTTWTQQTSEASDTYTFAGNEIDIDSEIKKTSILKGFVNARYVKITPLTSSGIKKAQFHYKGKGQCSHNQNEGIVAGITQTSEEPDDTTCSNPLHHGLKESLFECAEYITQVAACGSEFSYSKSGGRRLWCGCVSKDTTCNHASGVAHSSGFNTYRLESTFGDYHTTRQKISSTSHITTTTFTNSVLANSVVLQLTKGFDTSSMRIRDIEIYDENDINIALKTKGASCVSSYYGNDPWPRTMMTESTKHFELGMKRKAVGSLGTETSCSYMFDPLIRNVRHAESADSSLNFLKGRIPRSASQAECYDLAREIFNGHNTALVSNDPMRVHAWSHLPSGCSIRTSGASSDWDVHFNTSPNQNHQSGWATIENKCLWSDKHCNNYGGHGQCGIYEDEIEKQCGQWDLCGGVICDDSYVHAVLIDTNTVCENRRWNKQVGIPGADEQANLAACATAIQQDPACGDVFTLGGDRWCGCVAKSSTCRKLSPYAQYAVYSLKKFCVARPALDPSTKSNSGKYAFIKHSGPKAECDGIIGHNDNYPFIHLHSESGDVGKRTGESLGMGWAEVTFPTGTRIKKIVVKQVYAHSEFKLIVRSGTVSDTSLEETLQTFDDCDATCTADDACNAFTYSEESGSCKTFSECPHLTSSNIDDSAKTYRKDTDYNEPILPSMRAGLWITDSEGSARSETGVNMVETSEGSYSRCQKDGCIFDSSKSCVDKPEIKLYPNTNSDCSMGESDSGNKNSELSSGNLPTFTKSTNSCTPSKYCKKVGNVCVIDQDKISNLRIHDPVNHGGKQCFLPHSIAVEKCKTWDKCIAVICGGPTMGDFCVARGQVTWRSHPSFTAYVKQAIPGLDMVGEENWYRVPQPKYQHSLLSGGAGYIQIGSWRIGDVDGENFAIGRKDVDDSVVVFTNSGYGTKGSTVLLGTTYGKMHSLGHRKLLGAPTGIKIGNGFIEFGKKWRLYLTTTKEILLLVHRSRGVSAAWQNTMTNIQFGVKPSNTDSTVTGGVSGLADEGIKAWEQSTANCDVGRCVTFGTKHGNEFIQIGPAIICT
jgi:hypothetical protein